MTDDSRKTLTEYLGKCWHKINNERHNSCVCGLSFALKNQLLGHIENDNQYRTRPLTTPADLYAVFSKMVERGEWEEFMEFAFDYSNEIMSPLNVKANRSGLFYDSQFDAWLSCYGCPEQIPERLSMAAEFIRGRRRK